MSTTAEISEPASELERLIADLSGSGLLVFVFGDGFTTAHLAGTTTPVFRGPADRRWWHVELGDDAAGWIMDVRVDEVTGVRFVRGPYPRSARGAWPSPLTVSCGGSLGYRYRAAPCCHHQRHPPGEEREMSKAADISEPASELEHLIADLSASGPLIFVFGDGFTTAHLTGASTPVFRGPADRRWWHVEIGDDAANWIMDVRVDQITGVRFVREPYL